LLYCSGMKQVKTSLFHSTGMLLRRVTALFSLPVLYQPIELIFNPLPKSSLVENISRTLAAKQSVAKFTEIINMNLVTLSCAT